MKININKHLDDDEELSVDDNASSVANVKMTLDQRFEMYIDDLRKDVLGQTKEVKERILSEYKPSKADIEL